MNRNDETLTTVQGNDTRSAVVVGGSIAGLLAARVLADHCDTVTLIDRDVFPVAPDHRKGVPQSHHAHALLSTGYSIIEQLFPGILDALGADGAATAANVIPVAIVSPHGPLRLPKQPEAFVSFSRVLLEWHVRERVARRPEVQIIANTEVTGLLTTPDRTRVTGVHLRTRGPEDRTTTLHADLVVDASGRSSRTPRWLGELGYGLPPVETINSNLRYVSRVYAKPAQFPAEWHHLIVNGRPPAAHAGFILAIDQMRWHVTLGIMNGEPLPTDDAGFLHLASRLPDPSIYEALRVAQPLTPVREYRTPENHLRRFERMRRWPEGLIVTGDAVCAFNPTYGQGMTVSALDAITLARCLQEERRVTKAHFAQHFQQQLAATVTDAWLLATNQDLRWPGVRLTGVRPNPALPVLHRALDLVLYSAVVDPLIAQAYVAVVMLAKPPRALFAPALFARVLAVAAVRTAKHLLGKAGDGGFALSPAALAALRAMPEPGSGIA